MIDSKAQYSLDHIVVIQIWQLLTAVKEGLVFSFQTLKDFPVHPGQNCKRADAFFFKFT